MATTESPSRIDVRRILRVGALVDGGRSLELDHGTTVFATSRHLASFNPVAGDYWVIPSAGHAYLLTKATFQKAYGAAENL
jgi:hypothetical protein